MSVTCPNEQHRKCPVLLNKDNSNCGHPDCGYSEATSGVYTSSPDRTACVSGAATSVVPERNPTFIRKRGDMIFYGSSGESK